MEQEHGGPVAVEQDHGVVDQARQDLVEVEPAADVGGDAAEGVRPVELVGDFVGGPPGRSDDHRWSG